MAEVYRAEHESIGASVAIKVLSTEFRNNPSVMVRFVLEARSASRVQHENVVEVTDFGETEDGRPFIVMEYLDGEDLGTTLASAGPLPWQRARPMLVQILAAVQATHDQQIVHRDLKPDNIFRIRRLGSEDFLKIFDFGIAKVLDSAGDTGLTLDGHVFGTPSYMSPEQCTGMPVDTRSDLYSVGVLAYQMLAGVLPFEAETVELLMLEHSHGEVPDMAVASPGTVVEPQVEVAIRRALAKEPSERFSTAKEFAQALLPKVESRTPGLFENLRALFR